QLLRILVVLDEPAVALEAARQARVLGADLRRMLLVVPEAGRAQLLLELGDAALEAIRVKGNHGPRQAGPRSPGAAGRPAGLESGRPSLRAVAALELLAAAAPAGGVAGEICVALLRPPRRHPRAATGIERAGSHRGAVATEREARPTPRGRDR